MDETFLYTMQPLAAQEGGRGLAEKLLLPPDVETRAKDSRQKKISKLSLSGSVCLSADEGWGRGYAGDESIRVTVEQVSSVYRI